jgi:hypothetical protein
MPSDDTTSGSSDASAAKWLTTGVETPMWKPGYVVVATAGAWRGLTASKDLKVRQSYQERGKPGKESCSDAAGL